jgi:molecular chaperone GrpE
MGESTFSENLGLNEASEPPNEVEIPPDGVANAADSSPQVQSVEVAEAIPEESLPANPSDIGLQRHLEAIDGRLDTLHQDFETKLKYDEAKDRQLDALHKELQAHRDDLYFKILRPILMDLIAMYDDLHSIARHEDGRDPADLSEGEVRMRRNLASFADTIEEILDRYGVSAFSDEGDTVSPQRQRSIKQVETNDAGQDRHIAERLRKGFCHSDKVLRPEIVATYRAARKQAVDFSNGGDE